MDWVVGITTVICVELMIRRKWYAWLLSLLNQAVWFTYIVTEKQWGLLPVNIVMVIQNTRGLIAWTRNEVGTSQHDKEDHLSDAADSP